MPSIHMSDAISSDQLHCQTPLVREAGDAIMCYLSKYFSYLSSNIPMRITRIVNFVPSRKVRNLLRFPVFLIMQTFHSQVYTSFKMQLIILRRCRNNLIVLFLHLPLYCILATLCFFAA